MFLTAMLSTKLAAVVASAVVAAGTVTGVGVAANNAAPGDTLYGFDCAMEQIGLGDGGVQERLQEATRLCERGEFEKGLNHAAVAVQKQAGLDENGQANGALVAAANALQNAHQTANQGESEQIRARAAEMLKWMASTQAQGADFGQGVAERARELVGAAEQLRNQAQTRTQTQDGEQNQTGEAYQYQNGEAHQYQNGEGSQSGK